MAQLLGAEYPAFLASYALRPSAGLRVNTLKLEPERLREMAPFGLTPLPWSPAAYLLADEEQPGKHPYHAAGLYYLQDPSAMLVAELLAPEPGARVLDLAAAPGGKATHLAALMGNAGLLMANETHPRRVWDLAENLERFGVRNAIVTQESVERLAERFAGAFDYVLLDAPCSGEGMFRKSDAARRAWSPELVQGCATRQALLLAQAAPLVAPGGRLAYVTCTFAPEEDERVVAHFLSTHSGFTLVVATGDVGAAGHPEWASDEAAPDLRLAVRMWPHRAPGEGHFIAVMQRAAGAALEPVQEWHLPQLPTQAHVAYLEFCRQTLHEVPARERLALVGTYLYQVPEETPDLEGLRYIHAGWWLGTSHSSERRGGKPWFEPSHALALALPLNAAQRAINLPPEAPELLAYQGGESFRYPAGDGWLLIGVDGYTLGWGRCVSGVVKNHYPRGLRRTAAASERYRDV